MSHSTLSSPMLPSQTPHVATAHSIELLFKAEGMHCAVCADTITQTLKKQSGIESASVDFVSGRVAINAQTQSINLPLWKSAVAKAGFELLEISPQITPVSGNAEVGSKNVSDVVRQSHRTMLWRWLVSGFCMMQVMMYTTPQYFASSQDLTERDVHLLNWAAWALTLPVIIFSCRPFFVSAWAGIRSKTMSMDIPVALSILIVLCVGTLVTLFPNSLWGRDTYFDSLTMFVFFLLTGRWVESRLRIKTVLSLQDLSLRLPQETLKQTPEKHFETVAVSSIIVGDMVRVLPGAIFPADGKITCGATWVDERLVSGESRPLYVAAGDRIVAGSVNQSAMVEVRVQAVGKDTRYAQMLLLIQSAATQKPNIVLLADRIAKPFLLFVCFAALAVFLYSVRENPARALLHAATVLVVTCPCALALATPVAMLASAGALAREGVLVRKLEALEGMAHIDRIIFDKTGTLTTDQLQVKSLAVTTDVVSEIVLHIPAITYALASSSLHPVSKALTQYLAQRKVTLPTAWSFTNIVETPGSGVSANLHKPDGTVQHFRLGSHAFVHTEITEKSPPPSQLTAYLADNNAVLAVYQFDEGLRAGAEDLYQQLQRLNVESEILSGDRPQAVARVAQALRITQARAACTPEEKLQRLVDCQNQHQSVAMVGDGLNDGAALAKANVSLVMGRAVPIAQTRADFVIAHEDISVITRLIAHARKTQHIIAQNLLWAAAYNVICIPLAILGVLPPWLAGLGMVVSSLLVTLNALRLTRVSKNFNQSVDILLLLIPLSVTLVLLILIALWRAIETGQFEHMEEEAKELMQHD